MRIFDDIIKSEAMAGCPQNDWERQCKTAKHIIDRFENNFKTQILADEVGMGKTYVALGIISNYIFQNNKNDRKVIIITPPSGILQSKWEQDIRSFDANYVCHNKIKKHLKPMLLKSCWDLLENLHDYENHDLNRITESAYRFFLLTLFLWGKERKIHNRINQWDRIGNINQYDNEYRAFGNQFSKNALYAFFDKHKNDTIKLINKNNDNVDCENAFKEFIRSYAGNQDSYEANIYILGMNSLRIPNINAWQFKRINTYYLSCLLTGRHQNTRNIVIEYLENKELITPRDNNERRKSYNKRFEELYNINLFGLQSAVKKCVDDKQVQEKWKTIVNDIVNGNPDIDNVKDFFKKDIFCNVLKNQLNNAGIELCIIDEVHNWKNGSNGAIEFRDYYSKSIKNKLIMSATPFQIHEDELKIIFDFVDCDKNKSTDAINSIYKTDNNLLKKCLNHSYDFQKSWAELKSEDIELFKKYKFNCNEIINDLSVTDTLKHFVNCINNYKKALDELQNELILFMVRHTKSRNNRNFHIGKDFSLNNKNMIFPAKTTLYSTDGYADVNNAFINFLAIRLYQKIRQDTSSKYENNAHLMGGDYIKYFRIQGKQRKAVKTKKYYTKYSRLPKIIS